MHHQRFATSSSHVFRLHIDSQIMGEGECWKFLQAIEFRCLQRNKRIKKSSEWENIHDLLEKKTGNPCVEWSCFPHYNMVQMVRSVVAGTGSRSESLEVCVGVDG
mmetsp:Transcript_10850/g.25158  ORF Transcript_10850/g.25158 Transcript_10850/m.25158 type:complete len:105 (-) Transcript_10850:302-616(-)